jgi:hypothetical protein
VTRIRPFGWVIIIVNVYFFVSLARAISSTNSDTTNGVILFIWLIFIATINVIMYVIYRITQRKRRKCPACASNVKVGVTSCSKCGFDFMKHASGTAEIEDAPKTAIDTENKSKTTESKRSMTILVAVIAVVLIYAFSTSNDDGMTSSTNTSTSTNSQIQDTNWIPTGFNAWSQDANVAYKWLDENEYSCQGGDYCWGLMVVTQNGCSNNLYVELSILDKNDVQIGYTNDTVSSALPLQKSKLVFDTYLEDSDTARISKISCY